MRPKVFIVAGLSAYAVGLVCLVLESADVEIPTSALAAVWGGWFAAVLWCLASAPAPKWKGAWVIGSAVFMYRTTETLFVLLLWTIQGFSP